MSYSVVSYLTDSSRIKKLYGSRDQALLASLLDELSEVLDELNDEFDFDEKIDDDNNSQAVLTDIINGEIRFPKIAYMYGYVYEKLCEYYGRQIIPLHDELSANYYWEIPKQTYSAFVPIPFSSDFPEIYSIPTERLAAEKSRFLALTQKEGVDGENLEMEKEDFAFSFDEAIKANMDLVFFLY